MTEEEAREWIAARYGTDKLARLEAYATMLLAANRTQNLISKTSETQLWSRHILDSAQLAGLASDAADWLDVGSGPGLPGVVLAILDERPVLLVEPRRKRVTFLEEVVSALVLERTSIFGGRVETLPRRKFAAVTARAFAPLPELLSSTYPFTTSSTIWVLPKGRTAQSELDEARRTWQGVFHVEQSLTDADARIIVAREVRPR